MTHQELVNLLWAFQAFAYPPSLSWQHACVNALRVTGAAACGAAEPLAADQIAALLTEAGMLEVLMGAVTEQLAMGSGSSAAGAGTASQRECSINFELPLGAM